MAQSAARPRGDRRRTGAVGPVAFHQIAAPGATRSILIVDDNIDTAETLSMLLACTNHEVSVAYSPAEALRTLQSRKPDIILLDIGLPGMNGFELARIIRRRPETASVLLVAVTGYGRDEDRARAIDAGFDAHLTKPAAFEDIDKLLKRRPRK